MKKALQQRLKIASLQAQESQWKAQDRGKAGSGGSQTSTKMVMPKLVAMASTRVVLRKQSTGVAAGHISMRVQSLPVHETGVNGQQL